jgi:two-component system, NarL family, sensor histidine kinase UhpB
LDLPRLVMRRAAVVAALGVLLTLVFGLSGMRDDVDTELAGAPTMAVRAERLAMLPVLPDDQAIQDLRQWRASGDLRHLRFQVADSSGRSLLVDEPQAKLTPPMRWLAWASERMFEAAPPFSVAWPLARPEGSAWTVKLSAAPESERVEALHALLEDVLLLGAVALGMLVVMTWNTRRAFVPLARLLDAIGGLEAVDEQGGGNRVRQLPTMPIAELETVAAALRHLDQSLAAAQQQRRQLAQQVLSLQEDERSRLARELHDEFGQHLTALRVNAAWLARRTADDVELLPVVRDMEAQCGLIQQDIRAVLARLRPLGSRDRMDASVVDADALAHLGRLLRELVASWSRGPDPRTAFDLALQLKASNGTPLDWDEHADRWMLPRDALLALYRISQEALTNATRHAQASRVKLTLTVTCPVEVGEAARIDWSASDDGFGLTDVDAALRRGNGLAGLKERIWALGADLHVGSGGGPGGRPGCRLAATVWVATLNYDPGHE